MECPSVDFWGSKALPSRSNLLPLLLFPALRWPVKTEQGATFITGDMRTQLLIVNGGPLLFKCNSGDWKSSRIHQYMFRLSNSFRVCSCLPSITQTAFPASPPPLRRQWWTCNWLFKSGSPLTEVQVRICLWIRMLNSGVLLFIGGNFLRKKNFQTLKHRNFRISRVV